MVFVSAQPAAAAVSRTIVVDQYADGGTDTCIQTSGSWFSSCNLRAAFDTPEVGTIYLKTDQIHYVDTETYGPLHLNSSVLMKSYGDSHASIELEAGSAGDTELFNIRPGGVLSVADMEFSGFKDSVFYLGASSSLAMDNCNVTGNSATVRPYGAGIYCESCDSVQVTNSIFSNNAATLRGAAIYAYGATNPIVLDGTVLRNNSLDFYQGAASTGGGMYLGNSKANISGSVFSDNMAVRGGALYIAASGFESLIHDSKFLNNKARSGGGALYKYSGDVMSRYNTYTGNLVTANDGGAWYIRNKDEVATSYFDSFTSNTAERGGAMANRNNGEIVVEQTTFADNVATTLDSGGDIYDNGESVTLGCDATHGSIDYYGQGSKEMVFGSSCVPTPVPTLTYDEEGAGVDMYWKYSSTLDVVNETIASAVSSTGDWMVLITARYLNFVSLVDDEASQTIFSGRGVAFDNYTAVAITDDDSIVYVAGKAKNGVEDYLAAFVVNASGLPGTITPIGGGPGPNSHEYMLSTPTSGGYVRRIAAHVDPDDPMVSDVWILDSNDGLLKYKNNHTARTLTLVNSAESTYQGLLFGAGVSGYSMVPSADYAVLYLAARSYPYLAVINASNCGVLQIFHSSTIAEKMLPHWGVVTDIAVGPRDEYVYATVTNSTNSKGGAIHVFRRQNFGVTQLDHVEVVAQGQSISGTTRHGNWTGLPALVNPVAVTVLTDNSALAVAVDDGSKQSVLIMQRLDTSWPLKISRVSYDFGNDQELVEGADFPTGLTLSELHGSDHSFIAVGGAGVTTFGKLYFEFHLDLASSVAHQDWVGVNLTLNSPADVYCIATAPTSSTRRLRSSGAVVQADAIVHRQLATDFQADCSNYTYRLWDVAGNGWTGTSLIVMNETSATGVSVTLESGSSDKGKICLADGIYYVYCDGEGSNPGQNGWTFGDLYTGECPSSPAYFQATEGVATQVGSPTVTPTSAPSPVPTTVTAWDPSLDVLVDLRSAEYSSFAEKYQLGFHLNASTAMIGQTVSYILNVSGFTTSGPGHVTKADFGSYRGIQDTGSDIYGFEYNPDNTSVPIYLYDVAGLSTSQPAEPLSYDLFCRSEFLSVLRDNDLKVYKNTTSQIVAIDESEPVLATYTAESVSYGRAVVVDLTVNEPSTVYCGMFEAGYYDESNADDLRTQLLSSGTSLVVAEADVGATLEMAVKYFDEDAYTFSEGPFYTKYDVFCVAHDDGQIDSTTAYSAAYTPQSYSEYNYMNPEQVLATKLKVITGGRGLEDLVRFWAVDNSTSEAGGTAELHVVLKHQPESTVLLEMYSSDYSHGVPSAVDGYTTTTAHVTFEKDNWDVPQTVIMVGQNDGIDDGAHEYSAILQLVYATDPAYRFVPADMALNVTLVSEPLSLTGYQNETIWDKDAGIALSLAPGSRDFTTADGASATILVSMSVPPTAPVYFMTTTSDESVATLQPTSIVFTPENYAHPKVLTVTGVDTNLAVDSTYDVEVMLVSTEDPFFTAVYAGVHQSFSMKALRKLQDRISVNASFTGDESSCTVSEELGKEGQCVFTLSLVDSNDRTAALPSSETFALGLESVAMTLTLDDKTEVAFQTGENPNDDFVFDDVAMQATVYLTEGSDASNLTGVIYGVDDHISDGNTHSTLTLANAFFVINGERYPNNDKVCLLVQMFDEFGDGWDDITWSLTEQSTGSTVATGGLSTGASGSATMCGLVPECYYFDVTEGLDGGDVSWIVSQGGSVLARADGAPTSGAFCLGQAFVNATQIGTVLDIVNEDNDGMDLLTYEMHNTYADPHQLDSVPFVPEHTCYTGEDEQYHCNITVKVPDDMTVQSSCVYTDVLLSGNTSLFAIAYTAGSSADYTYDATMTLETSDYFNQSMIISNYSSAGGRDGISDKYTFCLPKGSYTVFLEGGKALISIGGTTTAVLESGSSHDDYETEDLTIAEPSSYEVNSVFDDALRHRVDMTSLLVVVPYLSDYTEGVFEMSGTSGGASTFGFCVDNYDGDGTAAVWEDSEAIGCFMETVVFNGTGAFDLNLVGRDDAVDDGQYRFDLTLVPATLCNVTHCSVTVNGTSLAMNSMTITSFNLDDDTAGVTITQSSLDFATTVTKRGNYDYTEVHMADTTSVSLDDDETSEEGDSVVFEVQLSSQPVDTVSVFFTTEAVNPNGGDLRFEGYINGSSYVVNSTYSLNPYIGGTRDTIANSDGYLNLTFTNETWNTTQTVEVVGLNDWYDDYDVDYEITVFTFSEGDAQYGFVENFTLPLTNLDDDKAELVAWEVSEMPGYVSEPTYGLKGEIRYYLATEPKSAVLVAAGSTDEREAKLAGDEELVSITYTNWETIQTATLSAVDDFEDDGDVDLDLEIQCITLGDPEYTQEVYTSFPFTKLDDPHDELSMETADVYVNVTKGSNYFPSSNGGEVTIELCLTSQPIGIVFYDLYVSDARQAKTDTTQVQFDSYNWNITQQVTITGCGRLENSDYTVYTVNMFLRYSEDPWYTEFGDKYLSLPLFNIPSENFLDIRVAAISENYTTTGGGTSELQVRLTEMPDLDKQGRAEGVDVRFAVTVDNPEVAVVQSPSTLIFTERNWDVYQSVYITGRPDSYVANYSVEFQYLGSDDPRFTTQQRSVSFDMNNYNDTNYLAWEVAAHSNDYTTTSGLKMEVWVVLTQAPADGKTVQFGVSTSDPSRAFVSSNPLLVFTTDNWDVGSPVTIEGVYNSDEGEYELEFTFIGSDDLLYSGQAHNLRQTVAHREMENFLFLEIAEESDLFTTWAGGTVQLLARITEEPAADTTLVYDVSVSDPTVATVLYPSTLVFSPDNWDIAQAVYVKGLDANLSTTIWPSTACNGTACNGTTLNSTNTSWVSLYTVDFSLTKTTDLLLSTQRRSVSFMLENRPPYNDIYLVVSDHSVEYTTTGGGIVDMYAYLRRAPSPGTKVRYTITTSDPDTAYVTVGHVVVFTEDNWDIGVPVTVTGVYQTNYARLEETLSNGQVIEKWDYNATAYDVQMMFLDSTDESFNGHQHITTETLYNLPAFEALSISLGPESLDFTTVAGGTVVLLVTLDYAPAANTTVRFSVDTSATAIATVTVGSTLVFTPQNWNVSHTVVVKGQAMPGVTAAQPYFVDFIMMQTDDPRFSGHQHTVSHPLSNYPYEEQFANGTTGVITTMFEDESPTYTTELGGESEIKVYLSIKPEPFTSVIYHVSCSDPSEATISPDTLVFTADNYDTGLSVFVVGLWDDLYDGDVDYTVYFHFNKVWSAMNTSSTLTEFAYGKYPETSVQLYNVDAFDIEMGETVNLGSSTQLSGISADEFDAEAQADFIDALVASLNISYLTADMVVIDDFYNTRRRMEATLEDEAEAGLRSRFGMDSAMAVYNAGGRSLLSSTTLTITYTFTVTVETTTESDADALVEAITSAVTAASNSSALENALASTNSTVFVNATVTTSTTDTTYSETEKGYVILKIAPGSNTATTEVGGRVKLHATLDREPNVLGDGVSFLVTTSNPREAVIDGPSSIQFTLQNWNIPQAIYVKGLADEYEDGPVAYNVSLQLLLTANMDPYFYRDHYAYGGVSLELVNIDGAYNGTMEILMEYAETSDRQTDESGGMVELMVTLSRPPPRLIDGLPIMFTTDDPSEAIVVYPNTIMFTHENWNIGQPLYIQGQYDDIDDGDVDYQVHAYLMYEMWKNDADRSYFENSRDFTLVGGDFNLTNLDSNTTNMTTNALVVEFAPDSIRSTDEAGAIVELHVTLEKEMNWKTEVVTFDVFSADPTEGQVLYPSTIAFTHDNWDIPQSVYVEGQYDTENDGDMAYNISFHFQTEYTIGYSQANDPMFARYHYRYPTQYFELRNLDSGQTVSNRENGIIITVAADSRDYTTEYGGIVELNVKLEQEPNQLVDEVVFDAFTSDATEGVVKYPTSVTFTHQNWHIPQPVYIEGQYDAENDGDRPYNITFEYRGRYSPGANPRDMNDPSFARYHYKYPSQSVTIYNVDSNVTTADSNGLIIELAPDSPSYTDESGGVVELHCVLEDEPNTLTESVSFDVYTNDPTEGVVMFPSTIRFDHDNWHIPQSVYVQGQYDTEIDGDTYYDVSFKFKPEPNADAQNDPLFKTTHWSYPIQKFELLNIDTAQNVSNRENGIVITVAPDSRDYTTESGGIVELNVKLEQAPNQLTDSVIFDVFTSDATEGVVKYPTSVTFTHQNWNISQPVYIEGQYDTEDDGDVTYNISFAYSGEFTPGASIANDPSFARYHYKYPTKSISITNYDSRITADSANGLIIDVAPDSRNYTDESGGIVELHVRLMAQPNRLSEAVVFDVFTSDATEGVVMFPSSVSFTHENWDVKQPIYVQGQYDEYADGDTPYNITFQYRTEWTATQFKGNDPLFERHHYRYPLQYKTLVNLDSQQNVTNRENRLKIKLAQDSEDHTDEAGGEVELLVELSQEPNILTETVIFDVFTSDASEGQVMYPSSVIFTHQNWNISQPVYIKGVYDPFEDGDKDYFIRFSYVSENTPGAPDKTNDPSFARYHYKYPIQQFKLSNWDSRMTTSTGTSNGLEIKLAPDSLNYTTEAGGMVELLVALKKQPNYLAETVVFNVYTSDATEGVVAFPSTVGFTRQNWNTTQPVFIKGMFDDKIDGDKPYEVLFEYQPVNSEAPYGNDPDFMRYHYRYPVQSYNLTNIDTYGQLRATTGTEVGKGGGYYTDDGSLVLRSKLSVTRADASPIFTTEAGSTVELRAVLDTPVYQGSTVSYAISTSDATEATVDNPAIVFDSSNWDIPVPVVVRGEFDSVCDGDVTYTVDFTLEESDDPLYSRTHYKDPGVSFPLVNVDSYENGTYDQTQADSIPNVYNYDFTGNETARVFLGDEVYAAGNNGKDGYLIVEYANGTDGEKINHRRDVDQSAYTSTYTTASGGMVALQARLPFPPSRLAPDGVTFVVGVSDPTEASVYYPSTLHFTRQNWYIPQLVYIVGLWDGYNRDAKCNYTAFGTSTPKTSCDQEYDVTFTLDQHATVMDPFFSRRLYTYSGTKFSLLNRYVEATTLYLGSFSKNSDWTLEETSSYLCATEYTKAEDIPDSCELVYEQPDVIPRSFYNDEDGNGLGWTDGMKYCMDNCFTTESGSVTYATAYLTKQPSLDTYVQYAIAVSDPTEAAVVSAPYARTSTTDESDDTDYYGQTTYTGGASDLVFTSDNWNLGMRIAIQGVEDCYDCAAAVGGEDGDIIYSVDFFMTQTNDKRFTDIVGTRLPMKNQDQVINRIAVATDYNCKVVQKSEVYTVANTTIEPWAGNYYHASKAEGVGTSDVQTKYQCWDPNVTATWYMDTKARYHYADDRKITISYDLDYVASSEPSPVPTASGQPTRETPTPTPGPTTHLPTGEGRTQKYDVGCLLDEAGEKPCALQLTICQASTDTVPYDLCQVMLPALDTFQVGIESITIDMWLDDPTEAQFVAPPGSTKTSSGWEVTDDDTVWYTADVYKGSRYCDDGSIGFERPTSQEMDQVDFYGFNSSETRPCTNTSAQTEAMAEHTSSDYMVRVTIADSDSSTRDNYTIPIWMVGRDDNIIDGPQLFRVNTRARIIYSGGNYYPADKKGCETSSDFPIQTYMGVGNDDIEDTDCYLDTVKHYDMLEGLKQAHFWAATLDDDEQPTPILTRVGDNCKDIEGWTDIAQKAAETSETLQACEVTITLSAQPQKSVFVDVSIDNPEVNCTTWSDNTACIGNDPRAVIQKEEALIALEANVEGSYSTYTVELTEENWNTGVSLYVVGVDDKDYEQADYSTGGCASSDDDVDCVSNWAGKGNTVPYFVVLENSESNDAEFNRMEEVRYLFHNVDDEAGAMSVFTSNGTLPVLQNGDSSYSQGGSPAEYDKQMKYPSGGVGFAVDENGRYGYFGVKYVSTASFDDDATYFIEVPVFVSVCNVETDTTCPGNADGDVPGSALYTKLVKRESDEYVQTEDNNGNPLYKFKTTQPTSRDVPPVTITETEGWSGALDPDTDAPTKMPDGRNNLLAVNITNMYDCLKPRDQYIQLWWDEQGRSGSPYEYNVIDHNSSFIGCMRIYEDQYWQYGQYKGLDDFVVQEKRTFAGATTRGRAINIDFGPTLTYACTDIDNLECNDFPSTDSNLTYSLKVTNVDNDVLHVSKKSCTTTEISGTNRTYLNPALYYYDEVVKTKGNTNPKDLPTPMGGFEHVTSDDVSQSRKKDCPYCFTYCEFNVSIDQDYFWSDAAQDTTTLGTTMHSAHVDITSPTFGLHDRFRASFDEVALSAANYPENNTEGTLFIKEIHGAENANATWTENTTLLHFYGGATFTLVMVGENDLVDDGDVTYPVYFDQVTVSKFQGERTYVPGKPVVLHVTNEDDETAGITWLQQYNMYDTTQLAGIMWAQPDDDAATSSTYVKHNTNGYSGQLPDLFGNGAAATDLYSTNDGHGGKIPSTMPRNAWQRSRDRYTDLASSLSLKSSFSTRRLAMEEGEDGEEQQEAEEQRNLRMAKHYPEHSTPYKEDYQTFYDRNERDGGKHWHTNGNEGAERLKNPRNPNKVFNTGAVAKSYGGEDEQFSKYSGGTQFAGLVEENRNNKTDGYEALANMGASNAYKNSYDGSRSPGWGGYAGGSRLDGGYLGNLGMYNDANDFNYSFTYTTYKNKRDPSDVWFEDSICDTIEYTGASTSTGMSSTGTVEHCHRIQLPDNVTAEGGGNTTIGLFLMSQPTDYVFVRVWTEPIGLTNNGLATGLDRFEAIPMSGSGEGVGVAVDKYSDYTVFRGPKRYGDPTVSDEPILDPSDSPWVSGYEDIVTASGGVIQNDDGASYYVPFTPEDYHVPKFVTIFGLDDMWDDYNQTYTVRAEVWDQGFKCLDRGEDGIDTEAGSGQRDRWECSVHTTTDKVYTRNSIHSAQFPMINVDDDDFDLFMDTDSHLTSEPDLALSATATVWLSTRPKKTVLLSVVSSVPNEAAPQKSLLAISSLDWTTKKEVLIGSIDDRFKDGDVPFNISVEILFSDDEDYGATLPNREGRAGLTALKQMQRFISKDDLADDSATACARGYYGYFCRKCGETTNDYYNCKKCPQGTYKDWSGDSYDSEYDRDLYLAYDSDDNLQSYNKEQVDKRTDLTIVKTVTVRGGSGCRMCPPGTYGVLEASQGMYNHEGWYAGKLVDLDPGCLPCGEGTYNDEWGATECKPCSEYAWPQDLHGPEQEAGKAHRGPYEGDAWCGPWGTVTPTTIDYSNKTSSYDTKWMLLEQASFSVTLTWATNPLDGSAWPGSMDEEDFASFLTQCALLIIAGAVCIVCCIKKCGRKTDWQRFKMLVKKADVFKNSHVGGSDGEEDEDEDEEEDAKEPQGEILGGIMTLAFIVFLGGLLFIAFIMYMEYNAESTQVLMPKYAQSTYDIRSFFSLDVEVVGFTGCWNGTSDTDGKAGVGYPTRAAAAPHRGRDVEGERGTVRSQGQLFEPLSVTVVATGLCGEAKVAGQDCMRTKSGVSEHFCTRREHLEKVQIQRCGKSGAGHVIGRGSSCEDATPWQGHDADLDPNVGSSYIQASGVNNLWIHWEATKVYVAVAPRVTVYIKASCSDPPHQFVDYAGDGKRKYVGDQVTNYKGEQVEACGASQICAEDADNPNPIYEPSHCVTISAIGYYYTIRSNSVYGNPYEYQDLNSILKIIPQYDDNALSGYMSAGFPGNTRFRGGTESVVTIALIPEYYSDNYNEPACNCNNNDYCDTCPYGSARRKARFYRLQYVQEKPGTIVDFGTHTGIFNSSTLDAVQIVGKNRRNGGTGMYANFAESTCRSIDFLLTTSECYLKYKKATANGMRAGVTQDDGSKIQFIDSARIGKDGTGVDSQAGQAGNPDGNGEDGATISDELIFEIAFQDSQVELKSSIDAIQTWQDVMGSIGGFVAVAMGMVLNLMNSIETSMDPEGPIAEKMKKLGDVAKSTGQRAAKAGGVNMAEETPDVIFSDESHIKDDDIEMPGTDADFDVALSSQQPDFDSLVLMSQLPSTRSTRSEVSGVSLVSASGRDMGSGRSVMLPSSSVTQI